MRSLAICCLALLAEGLGAAENLLPDPSFEEPKARDRWGAVFAKWGGWAYEGECEFRVSDVAHTGEHALLLVGGSQPKIRAWPAGQILDPGRYRVTAWIRGLDIGMGVWNQTTELMFAGKYMPLSKNGTFGWTKLSYVGVVREKGEAAYPSFGLMAPGYLWVDDVALERVSEDVPLTEAPLLGEEESPVEPPGDLSPGEVRCAECGYRNMPSWVSCYACGSNLAAREVEGRPQVHTIASFEDENPFDGGAVGESHATEGRKALRVDRGYVSMDRPQDWTGYDWIEADAFVEASRPLELYFEVRDDGTRDYWTRVNYTTVVPPGRSTIAIPTRLYVGEKSRPGRPLNLRAITRVVFSIGEDPAGPIFLDAVRLRRDTEADSVRFEGLWALDLGPRTSPLMEGFVALDPSKVYTRGRGYGWKDARFWRAFDALQPEPLYQDFICVEEGGIAIDLPDGAYHVFVNMDSPSGYWGEVQTYRRRTLILEGEEHVDVVDREEFVRRYYRHWDSEDLPGDDTFSKYQLTYFREKELDVEVRDGRLDIGFRGENWGCSVSAVVVYPLAKAAEGRRFLDFVRARRRFHFENAFKRVLHAGAEHEPTPTAEERRCGFIPFARDWMERVFYDDRPAEGERLSKILVSAFVGEAEPSTFSLLPLMDLGTVTVSVGDLDGPGGRRIPAASIDVGHVQHRISRVTMEGSVYTIEPRLIIPSGAVAMPEGMTRTFWLTVKVPGDAVAGLYRGSVTISSGRGAPVRFPLELTVREGTLDPVDIPVGPWGHTIDLPWFREETAEWNRDMAARSLRKLRECGFTTASGLPVVAYKGFRDGAPALDFSVGDAQMSLFRECGFRMPVVSYCAFSGLNTYYRDTAVMEAAGFRSYPDFLKAVFGAVQEHASETGWLPVYWNIGDEPIGEDLLRSAENAEAYREAFPEGPPYFTAASSFAGSDESDPHLRLSRALHVADWNVHDEAGVHILGKAGGSWAFYNGGNRWTYGVYLYKAAKEFGMKFRLSWHWNVVAGDPYYALDCREDDYAWCNSNPAGELIPSIHFEELREGLDDYRRLLTLARLAAERRGTQEARAATDLLGRILGAFRLGDRELKGPATFAALREEIDPVIERLR